MQRSFKTVLVAAIFPEQAPGYGPRLPIKYGCGGLLTTTTAKSLLFGLE
jgi:hypothetical protein